MTSPVSGQIVCNNIPNSRTVRRFIEKQILRWALRHGVSEKHQNQTPRYFVSLQREKEGHGVNCRIEISDGKTVWKAMEYASGLHQALIRCLNHLMPIPTARPVIQLA